MALVIEAPNEIYSTENNSNVKLFLAGGIQQCENWQNYVITELNIIPNLTIYNPRRKDFPIWDPIAAEIQITWEFNHLRDSSFIFFWFAKGSLNPIVLYELGMWGNSNPDQPIILGVDPLYERKQDVVIQTQLAKPGLPIYDSIGDMIKVVFELFEED